MEREQLLRELLMADGQAAASRRRLERQGAIVDKLIDRGQDPAVALELLRHLEEAWALHVAEAARYRQALAVMNGAGQT